MCRYVVLAAALVVGSCNSAPEQTSPEGMLAAIDAGNQRISEGEIRPYAILLDALEERCVEPRMKIADFTVVAVDQIARRSGRDVENLSFLRMMTEAVPSEAAQEGGLNCTEIAAAVVLLSV